MFSPLDLISLFGSAAGEVAGWTWDKVIQGVFVWFANGLLLLIEWVWGVLDTASTPRLTDDWFASGLFRPLASLAVGITIAMMLMSAIQAGVGGRPELIVDALSPNLSVGGWWLGSGRAWCWSVRGCAVAAVCGRGERAGGVVVGCPTW